MRPPLAQTSRRRCRNLNRLSIAYASRPRLRPDSPRVDQPCSGTLGHSVRGILTRVALLIPAFSLATAPRLARAAASPPMAMLPYRAPRTEVRTAPVASVACLSPLGLSAPRHSRPVSYYALFQGWLLLSQPPGCLRVATTFPTEHGFRDLSRRSGLFPSRRRIFAPAVSLRGGVHRHSRFGLGW